MSSISSQPESATRQQILEKFLSRMRNLSVDAGSAAADSCPELNPDIIVISDGQTMIFEAQNECASALLRRKCGWNTEIISVRERIRVHPSKIQKLIQMLSAAGLKVAY